MIIGLIKTERNAVADSLNAWFEYERTYSAKQGEIIGAGKTADEAIRNCMEALNLK